MKPLSLHQEEIRRLCRQFGVTQLSAFGSVLGERFTDQSDIDLIVSIDDTDPISYSDKYFNLKFALEGLLGRPVDLLEERANLNPLLKRNIDRSKVQIYGI